MDLTSRKAVHDGMTKYGFVAPDMTVHEFVEDELPSVPAVPLDKLCEALSKHLGNPPCPCGYDLKGTSCNPDWTRKECWHNCLTNWMEEQNEG